MSTPNYEATPPQQLRQMRKTPMDDQELRSYMQQMIEMQYEQQRYANFDNEKTRLESQRPASNNSRDEVVLNNNNNDNDDNDNNNDSEEVDEKNEAFIRKHHKNYSGITTDLDQIHSDHEPFDSQFSSDETDGQLHNTYRNYNDDHDMADTSTAIDNNNNSSNSSRINDKSQLLSNNYYPSFDSNDDVCVGKGTILFPQGRTLPFRTDSIQSDNASLPASMLPPVNNNNNALSTNTIISYGTLNDSFDKPAPSPRSKLLPPASSTERNGEESSLLSPQNLHQLEQQQQQLQQDHNQEQQYLDVTTKVIDFQHYNIPSEDGLTSYDLDDLLQLSGHPMLDFDSKLSKFCCCFSPLFVCCKDFNIFSSTCQRSFCYGAIDGMLTGSGIVASLVGLGWLTMTADVNEQGQSGDQNQQYYQYLAAKAIRLWVVAFVGITCFADSVCMALGHIWTTHTLATIQANERQAVQKEISQNHARAKGQIVDLLLSKGMLKMDALSMADTLAGYPDLMVSVLTSETLSVPTPVVQTGLVTPDTLPAHVRPTSSSGILRLFGYNALLASTAQHVVDPEALAVSQANAEARRESLCMLLGFSLFALVPSLAVFWCLPYTASITTEGQNNAAPIYVHHTQYVGSSPSSATHYDAFNNNSTGSVASPMTDPHTLVILITAVIMGLLGMWKSTFVDGNWLLFGTEAVVVLLVCIGVAFGLGVALNYWLLPGYTISVTPSL